MIPPSTIADCDALARRCLKPDPATIGTWTARRWGRPAALRITRIVAPHGWTADGATAAACLAAMLMCAAFATGGTIGLVLGCLLMHVWYLLDHVDGQLARFHGTASLDGTAWDYLMHHGVQLFVPQSLGFGLFRESGSSAWLILGAAWGGGTLLLGLRHDVRYKAFVQRLKRLHGELRVVGGGGGRPCPGMLPMSSWRRTLSWLVMKSYEAHIVMLLLTIIAALRLVAGELGMTVWQIYVAAMSLPAPLVGAFQVARMVRRGRTEQEFAAWFRVPEESTLEFRDGWWYVVSTTSDPRRFDLAASSRHAGLS